jgi:hypothetical protein
VSELRAELASELQRADDVLHEGVDAGVAATLLAAAPPTRHGLRDVSNAAVARFLGSVAQSSSVAAPAAASSSAGTRTDAGGVEPQLLRVESELAAAVQRCRALQHDVQRLFDAREAEQLRVVCAAAAADPTSLSPEQRAFVFRLWYRANVVRVYARLCMCV